MPQREGRDRMEVQGGVGPFRCRMSPRPRPAPGNGGRSTLASARAPPLEVLGQAAKGGSLLVFARGGDQHQETSELAFPVGELALDAD